MLRLVSLSRYACCCRLVGGKSATARSQNHRHEREGRNEDDRVFHSGKIVVDGAGHSITNPVTRKACTIRRCHHGRSIYRPALKAIVARIDIKLQKSFRGEWRRWGIERHRRKPEG